MKHLLSVLLASAVIIMDNKPILMTTGDGRWRGSQQRGAVQLRVARLGEHQQVQTLTQKYLLYLKNIFNRFQIDPDTGDVISTASFLGQAGAAFEMRVMARDQRGQGLSATKILLVKIFVKSKKIFEPLWDMNGWMVVRAQNLRLVRHHGKVNYRL